MSSNESDSRTIPDTVLSSIMKSRERGKPFLLFQELINSVKKELGDELKPKELREAIGALKDQGKIGCKKVAGREIFYLLDQKGPKNPTK